jgi:predicted amidophosphoribosyltransferase
MNSISVSFHPQKEPVVCSQCGSTARVARGLCLRCMLLLGIAACGDTSEILNDALSEIDVQDAQHVVGELVRHSRSNVA